MYLTKRVVGRRHSRKASYRVHGLHCQSCPVTCDNASKEMYFPIAPWAKKNARSGRFSDLAFGRKDDKKRKGKGKGKGTGEGLSYNHNYPPTSEFQKGAWKGRLDKKMMTWMAMGRFGGRTAQEMWWVTFWRVTGRPTVLTQHVACLLGQLADNWQTWWLESCRWISELLIAFLPWKKRHDNCSCIYASWTIQLSGNTHYNSSCFVSKTHSDCTFSATPHGVLQGTSQVFSARYQHVPMKDTCRTLSVLLLLPKGSLCLCLSLSASFFNK